MKSAVDRIFVSCLMVLGGVIALDIAVSLLSEIWQWIVGIAIVIGVTAAIAKIVAAKRRQW